MSSQTKVTSYLLLESLNGRLYFRDLLHEPVGWLVSAELNVGPHVPVGQPGAGHLVRRVLLPDGVLEVPDHRLHLRNLVHCLLQVGLQLPGGLLALGDPVSEALLDPVRLLPQVLAGVGQGAPDDASQADAGLPLLLGQPGQHNITLNVTEQAAREQIAKQIFLKTFGRRKCQTFNYIPNVIVAKCLPVSR